MDLSIQCFVRIILIWLLCLLSVLLHESGHALGYRISGGKAGWKVVVGSGPRLISISRFTFGLIPAGLSFLCYRVICRGFESDGLQIIHILKHNKAS